MRVSKNIPKLRFKGLDDEWKSKKLGEIINVKSSKYNPQKESKSYKCIELEHLSSNTSLLLGYTDSVNSASIKNKFEKNDVLFGKLRPYLRKYLLAPFDGVCSSEIWVMKGEGIANQFLFNIIQTEYFIDLANQSTGSKMPRADWNVVSSAVFNIPTLPEQQKIASFLSAIDEKIQQLTRKKELLEQYKKGVMQRLFLSESMSELGLKGLKDDRINPSIQKSYKSQFRPLRFKDENGKAYPKWEEKRLGEVAEFLKGKGISKLDIDDEGNTECIRYGQLYTDYKETISKVISRTSVATRELVLSEANDVIIPASGETQIDIATASCVLRSGIALGGDLNIIRTNMNGVFLSYYLNTKKKFDIARLSQGITVVHLYPSQLGLLKLSIPCKEEQQKIASYLSSLDSKIEQVAAQIAQSQKFKKGLLQQMFV